MARILVVDDDEMQRLLERTILEDAGHELTFASDGADALIFFRRNDVDVVVTDLNMPRIDGLKVIEGVMEIDDRVPVVVVSGVESERLDRAMELGAFKALLKPVDPQDLLDAVTAALELGHEEDWL